MYKNYRKDWINNRRIFINLTMKSKCSKKSKLSRQKYTQWLINSRIELKVKPFLFSELADHNGQEGVDCWSLWLSFNKTCVALREEGIKQMELVFENQSLSYNKNHYRGNSSNSLVK